MSHVDLSRQPVTVVVHRGRPGVLAGVLGCIFGLLGIFTFGIIFVPLAAICSVIGLLRGMAGRSGAGVGTSLLGGMLSVWGFIVSPTLWLVLGTGLVAGSLPAPSTTATHAYSAPQQSNPAAPYQNVPSPADIARERAVQEDRGFASGLATLLPRMDRFGTVADAVITKAPQVEHRYETITGKMAAYLQRERGLVGNSRADVVRSQISVEIGQGSIAANQLHNEVQPTQWDFDNNARPLMQQVSAAEQTCLTAYSAKSNRPEASIVAPACSKFLDMAARFHEKFDAVARALAHLEAKYQQEQNNQARLESEATRLE